MNYHVRNLQIKSISNQRIAICVRKQKEYMKSHAFSLQDTNVRERVLGRAWAEYPKEGARSKKWCDS